VGSIYLTWLADDLAAAGLQVVCYQGWTTRARSSGGYGGQPLCVMWHHTASQTSAENDCYYMCYSSGDKPICNLYIARDGAVWVLAAGATNTNGKGNAQNFSRGSVPKDQMNQWAVGMELGNAGTGESYPQAQIDAAFTVSNVVNRKVGNAPTDVCTHQRYAPDRKIDPAKGRSVQGSWQPREINSSGTWNLDDLRVECERRAWGTIPTPPDDEDDMDFDGFWRRDNSDAVYAIFKHGSKQWMTDPGYLNAMTGLWTLRGAPPEALGVRVQRDPAMFAAFGLVEGPREPGTDEWGNRV
jgi:N-acetylmuramoyl-L-alanine amidase